MFLRDRRRSPTQKRSLRAWALCAAACVTVGPGRLCSWWTSSCVLTPHSERLHRVPQVQEN